MKTIHLLSCYDYPAYDCNMSHTDLRMLVHCLAVAVWQNWTTWEMN